MSATLHQQTRTRSTLLGKCAHQHNHPPSAYFERTIGVHWGHGESLPALRFRRAYVQYRSGPAGFVHHLGGNQIAFADFRGNRQFVSTGNIDADGRVALFVADYPLRSRLKVFGRARVSDDRALLERLRRVRDGEISATCERSIVIDVEAFDWNCSRSLVPQYTADQVRERVQPYVDRMTELQNEVAAFRATAAAKP